MSTASDPATVLGPADTVVQGAEAVSFANVDGSSHFAGAERNDLETVHTGEEGDLAWWVGVQRSVVSVGGQDEPVPMDLRITELNCREDGAWKLSHRHADPLTES